MMFEDAWQRNQMAQRQKLMQQQGLAGNISGPGPQMSPNKHMTPQGAMQQSQQFLQQQQQLIAQQQQMQQQHGQATPVKQMGPMGHPQQPSMNGFSTPQQPQVQPQHPMGQQGHARNSLSRGMDSAPPQNGAFPVPSVSATKPGSLSLPSPQVDGTARPAAPPPGRARA